jgi:glycosyltransferase involved in cell wall biosynthesis
VTAVRSDVNGVTEVNQFHSGTAHGDAITNEMLEWREHLLSMGLRSQVYAQHIPEGLDHVLPIDEYNPSPGAVLLLHHSMGHDILEQVLDHDHRIVTVFHNITPLEFIDEPFYRRYARVGRAQLRRLAAVSVAGIADSNINRREMLRAGFRSAAVIPVRTDFTVFEHDGQTSRSNDWLFVGRVVPSKGQLELVDAFADALAVSDVGQSLVLVGDVTDKAYVSAIGLCAARREVNDRVELVGKVSDRRLANQYHTAGLFTSMSKHEGFGVPLLEAMAAGLPVVAYTYAAVAETMSGAGVTVPGGDATTFVAECVSLMSDTGRYRYVVAAEKQRISRLAAFDVECALRAVITEAGGTPRRVQLQVQGPFETTYSLAILNRELALALDRDGRFDVSIFATEGPGDYQPEQADLDLNRPATSLYEKSASVPTPDVVVRQMYPPRVDDSPGALTFQYFGWEESLLPAEYVTNFNRHLTGIGVMSSFVADVLRDSGVTVPISVVGVGVRVPSLHGSGTVHELSAAKSFRFLHISSAFPRKGVDILLDSYFAEFTSADDVTLVLKTFPNPHNEVGPLLQQLRSQHDDPPHVLWIDREMGEEEIDAMYAGASAYVHPARGEGFGLPVAEAMNASVPVISPASTGLADFVSDSTAWTIPFEATIAQTHLSTPGSMWMEPDGAALATAMRDMFSHRNSPLIAARVAAARELITGSFNWDAVARRFADFIDGERARVRAPSVALVSTWNSRCGIAEYVSDLVTTAGERWEPEIFADRVVETIDPARDEFVTRSWIADPRAPVEELMIDLERSSADIVHIQHNFGFLGLRQLGSLIRKEAVERGVVVTLHRTEDLVTPELRVHLADIADDLARADRVIVHQDEDAHRLREMGIDRVEVIPIGARQLAGMSTQHARDVVGLDTASQTPIIATYGFLLPHKGTLELIQAIGLLHDQGMEVAMLAVCALHTDPTSAAYASTCLAEISKLGLDDSIRLVTDFLQPEVSHLLLSTADIIALPYHESAESSSASLRFVLPVGRPVVASDIGIFRDARSSLKLVDAPPTAARLAAAIVELLSDPDALDDYGTRSRHLAHESSLVRSVDQHTQMYRAVQSARTVVDDAVRAQREVGVSS